MVRIVTKSQSLGLLAYPPPYRAWIAINSDPDHMTKADWQELHDVIWGDLELPFADTFFVENFNEDHPDQVSLRTDPEILSAHLHDTMHTWGDYVNAPAHTFTRHDAEAGLRRLQELNCRPLVWADHSYFSGNVIHRANLPAMPVTRDASGHPVQNHEYTLDLIYQAGVRYLWDGTIISEHWGQDRAIGRKEWYLGGADNDASLKRRLLPYIDSLISPLHDYVNPNIFNFDPSTNRQYATRRFPDGQSFYVFPRFGKWELADIDGLGTLLAATEVAKLVASEGTSIIYTHLGKRHIDRIDSARHIPDHTHAALSAVAKAFREKHLNVSPTSTLLDYLVLRDNIVIDSRRIEFRSDEIRFPKLCAADLAGHHFGVTAESDSFEVLLNGEVLDVERRPCGNKVYDLSIHA